MEKAVPLAEGGLVVGMPTFRPRYREVFVFAFFYPSSTYEKSMIDKRERAREE